MTKLYKINAEEITKLVSESKVAKPKRKPKKLINSDLPPKKMPKVAKIPLKRTEAELQVPSPEPTEEGEPEEVIQQEEPPKEDEKQDEPMEIEHPVPIPIIEEPKPTEAPVPKVDEEEAPKWFTKFCLQVKEEQERQAREAGEKKVPQRIIREEAEQLAQERWQDPRIREKVENKLTNNLKSIYSMVFPNRQY